MIRIIGVGIVGAVIGGFLTHGSQIGVWAGLIIGIAGSVVPLMAGTSALKCPFCRKRVKLGATHCHHCGRVVGRSV
jgi:hypothetical protein